MAIKKIGITDIKKIIALENTYNIKLPNDYVEFLLSFNGGITSKDENCKIFIESLQKEIHVDVLYGIKTNYENANINHWMKMFQNDMLKNALIIGDTIEHGFIVLICSEDSPCICYWDHTYYFDCSNDDNNTYFIADTFTDFAKNLLQG